MFCFHLRTANQLGNRVEKKNHIFWSRAGGTPLYRYVPSHRVGFLRRFGLKTGIHFAHFGLELGMVRSPFLDSDFFKQGPAYKKDGPDRERI